jgi:hypothetical protein
MNDIQALSIATTQNAGGDFPFAMEINNQRFQGYPVILSSTVTAGMVLLVDAADFIVIEGGAPRLMSAIRRPCTLRTPRRLRLARRARRRRSGACSVTFQTDSMALRMIMDINWGMRRTGVVAWTTGVTW